MNMGKRRAQDVDEVDISPKVDKKNKIKDRI